MKANQPTSLPTNKLTVGALIAPAASEVWRNVMTEIYPALAGPAMTVLIGALVGILAAYPVRDRLNVPVE